MNSYSRGFKENVIAQALGSGKPLKVLAEEFGIGYSTLGKWLRDNRNRGETPLTKQDKRPSDWSMQERYGALLETASLTEEELGRWCREHGVHSHQLAQWGQDAMRGTSGKMVAAKHAEVRQLREENRTLKNELRRKEKALAETAALLVLKKKAGLIWGEPEDD